MRSVFGACTNGRIWFLPLCLAALFVVTPRSTMAQQVSYLVTAQDSSLSVYDLTSNNLLEKINEGTQDRVVAVGPNSRLAFVSSTGYLSVIDLTLGHEIQRIRNVWASTEGNSMTFTRDGRLLVADASYLSLDIIDPAALTVVRRVSLSAVLGAGVYDLNTVLVLGNRAFVTSTFPDGANPSIAVVDLTTYTVRSISIPYGFVGFGGIGTMPNAGLTSDGRYLVTGQTDYSDFNYHLLLISTLTGRIVIDRIVSFDAEGILVNPVLSPTSEYGYYIGLDTNSDWSVTAIDLRPTSQTFGQLLTSTEVVLPYGAADASGASISPDGSRIVIGQFSRSSQGPLPNAFVIDTAKLLTDPSHAIVAQSTLPGGVQAAAVASTTLQIAPGSPTVSGVSGNITNDAPHTIHVFGSNFASGAQVRIGSMAPLAATVNSSTDLQVTVPANAPAAPGQDVLVTIPNVTDPPAQQNLSGLLARGLTVSVNTNFQPSNQLATLNIADGSFSVYDFTQRAMTKVALDPPSITNLTYNAAGTDLYAPSNGYRNSVRTPELLSLKLTTNLLTTIPVVDQQGTRYRGFTAVVSSRNPFTGGPVVYTWIPDPGNYDMQVEMVDADPSSPTFNTVLATFPAQQSNVFSLAFSGTATPDGKYVYVNFADVYSSNYYIAIFDIVHGGPATIIDPASIGALANQFDMVVSPDGSSLLLNATTNGGIIVEDISQNPLNPTPVATIAGSFGNPFLYCYQVVGNHLFALDIENNVLLAYNFDRQHSNFSRLGSYFFRGDFAGNPYIAVSPDGALIYLPASGDDMVSVFDANKLVSGQPPLLTNLASFRSPNVVAVSPASH